jgi:hypothetical protein
MHHDQIMESYTPLNNYLNNCVIKLHIKLHVHQKHYYKVVVFSIYLNLMHHGGYFKNVVWFEFATNDGLHLNISLCCEISAHMNNSIIILIIF